MLKLNYMKYFILIFLTLTFSLFLKAQTDFEKQINSYAGMLSEKITQAGKTKIAVSDFLDNNRNITELGKVIAEELGINISNTGKGFQVMEKKFPDSLFVRNGRAYMATMFCPTTLLPRRLVTELGGKIDLKAWYSIDNFKRLTDVLFPG